MRIACFGNMNNNLFALTRYLQDAGFDSDLLVFEGEFDHFKPEADCFGSPNINFVKKISWGNAASTLKINRKESIKELIDKYDFHIGCGAAPAYFNKAREKLDIFMPYCSDIYEYPFFRVNFSRYRKIFKDYYYAKRQKTGIRKAGNVILDVTNDEFENYLKLIKPRGKRYFSNIPFLYLPEYSSENIERYSKKSELFIRVKNQTIDSDFNIVMHYGHCWKNPASIFHNKGNDQVFIGLKKLITKYPEKKIKLFTFEYGLETNDSKNLIHQLGIEENVSWLPISYRKEIMMVLSLMDLGMGEICNSWFSYGTVYECIAAKLPVIMNRNDILYKSQYPEMYPVLNAQNPEEVFKQMEWAFLNKGKAKQMGLDANLWFRKYATEKPLRLIIDLINKKAKT